MARHVLAEDVERFRDAAEIVLSMERFASRRTGDEVDEVELYDDMIAEFKGVAEGYDWESPVATTRAYIILSRANLDDDGLAMFYMAGDLDAAEGDRRKLCIDEVLDLADGYDWNPSIRSGMYVEAMVQAANAGSKERIRRAAEAFVEASKGPTMRSDAFTYCAAMDVCAQAMVVFAAEDDEQLREEAGELFVTAVEMAAEFVGGDEDDEFALAIGLMLSHGHAFPDSERKEKALAAAFEAQSPVAEARLTRIDAGDTADDDDTWIRCCGCLASYWHAGRLMREGDYEQALREVDKALYYLDMLQVSDPLLEGRDGELRERLELAREYLKMELEVGGENMTERESVMLDG